MPFREPFMGIILQLMMGIQKLRKLGMMLVLMLLWLVMLIQPQIQLMFVKLGIPLQLLFMELMLELILLV